MLVGRVTTLGCRQTERMCQINGELRVMTMMAWAVRMAGLPVVRTPPRRCHTTQSRTQSARVDSRVKLQDDKGCVHACKGRERGVPAVAVMAAADNGTWHRSLPVDTRRMTNRHAHKTALAHFQLPCVLHVLSQSPDWCHLHRPSPQQQQPIEPP